MKRKKWLLILIIILVVLAVVFGFTFDYIKGYYIKRVGIELTPSQDYQIPLTYIYQQNDAEWGEDSIGDTDYKMSSHGCLVCAIANSLSMSGYSIDPQELNSVFTEAGVYDEDGNIIWYKIKDAVEGYDYSYERAFCTKDIEEDLENERYPIVKVKYKKTGIFHWVLIVGAKDGEFYIADSLYEGEAIPLSTHGRVYAYRVLVRDGAQSIRIKEYEQYDWSEIVDGLENKLSPEVYVRLVEYTMNNNLKIKTGKYVWDKDISFDQAIEVFDFALVEKSEELLFGKHNTFSISANEVFDWQEARDRFGFWLSNRAYIEVTEHMRDNNLKIAPGEYRFMQGTNYDDAMGMLEFEEIINPPIVETQKSISFHKDDWITINQILYFWLTPQDRIDLMMYMYKENCFVMPGEYIIKQDMSCEEVIQLFEFVTIDD